MSLPFCNSEKNVTNVESNVLVKIMNLSFTSETENVLCWTYRMEWELTKELISFLSLSTIQRRVAEQAKVLHKNQKVNSSNPTEQLGKLSDSFIMRLPLNFKSKIKKINSGIRD